tara:strand:+ start:647 stop:877 length:231 start_codon:yes stop_codon:yes gene_type:complete
MANATGNRKKLDKDGDGKITGKDLAMLRNKKGKGKMAKHTKKMSKGGAAKKKMMYGGAMGKKKTKKMSKGGAAKRK